jgi:hypothetical protein
MGAHCSEKRKRMPCFCQDNMASTVTRMSPFLKMSGFLREPHSATVFPKLDLGQSKMQEMEDDFPSVLQSLTAPITSSVQWQGLT